MRKLITITDATLDGVLQAPGGPEEDTSRNFKVWRSAVWLGRSGGQNYGRFYEQSFRSAPRKTHL